MTWQLAFVILKLICNAFKKTALISLENHINPATSLHYFENELRWFIEQIKEHYQV